MYYFLAHFPQIDLSQINEVRNKYDPSSRFVDPHIAVVFPVDSSIGESKLIEHIQTITTKASAFSITLKGLEKSWDHYLYLTVEKGAGKIKELHNKLDSGILEKYWFKDVPYKPHITLGFFAEKQAKFDKTDILDIKVNTTDFNAAISMAQGFDFNIDANFDRLSLVKRKDKQSQSKVVKEFIFS